MSRWKSYNQDGALEDHFCVFERLVRNKRTKIDEQFIGQVLGHERKDNGRAEAATWCYKEEKVSILDIGGTGEAVRLKQRLLAAV